MEITVEDDGVTGFTRVPHPQWVHDGAASDGTNPLDDDQRAYLHANMVGALAGALADRQFNAVRLNMRRDRDLEVGSVAVFRPRDMIGISQRERQAT